MLCTTEITLNEDLKEPWTKRIGQFRYIKILSWLRGLGNNTKHYLFYLFIYSFIHLFIYSFIYLFIYSFIHLFIYSFIHHFIYSFLILSVRFHLLHISKPLRQVKILINRKLGYCTSYIKNILAFGLCRLVHLMTCLLSPSPQYGSSSVSKR